MGLLDYYKQFDAIPDEEVNRQLRDEAAERKAKELARVETLDLSELTWHEPPHPDVVSAVTFIARRGMHRYPRGTELRNELAHLHGVEAERIALGNGATELIEAAASALARPGQTLLSQWPTHPLFPAAARRAHAKAVPVEGGVDGLLDAAAKHDTRLIALARPNDPTGELLSSNELERLMDGLDEAVAVLLDEALIEFAHPDVQSASLELLERYPRLLVFRSFSKAWGLAGLRCGYVVCGRGAEGLLAELAPRHGVSELSEAAALESLRACAGAVKRRAERVAVERERVTKELRERGFVVSDSEANFLWVASRELDGGALSARLRDCGILVANGAPLGDQSRVRITLRDEGASKRLLRALEQIG